MGKSRQDKKLFFRVREKNKDAFIEAYDLYADDIFRFIYFKIGNEEESKDMTSAVFLKVWNYAQSQGLDESKSLRAFIYRTARNLVIDHYRQSREPHASLDDQESGIDLADEGQDLAREMETLSDLETIKKGLVELKDEYREILLMRFVDELSFAEIAEITGKTQGNSRVLAFRALQALKEILEKERADKDKDIQRQ